MGLRRGRDPSVEIEALAWLSKFDVPQAGSDSTVRDSERVQEVIQRLKSGMDESLANQARLHGWRVQNLFEAMLACLGSVRLIASEDAGDYYFNDSNGSIKPPDFRVVRADGQRSLIEAKNVNPNITEEARIRERDLGEWQRYAELTGARLLLAHYWSFLNKWTIVDPSVLKRRRNHLALPLETAIKANELSLFGDAWIATKPPLVLSVFADPNQPQTVQTIDESEEKRGFIISRLELSCAGQTLVTKLEKRIAWFLMRHGGWEFKQNAVLDEEGKIERVDHIHTPLVPDEASARQIARQGLALVGSLSSMYSTLYNSVTLTEDGDIQRLRHEPDPGILAALIPDDYWEQPTQRLPIWKFFQNPSLGPATGPAPGQ